MSVPVCEPPEFPLFVDGWLLSVVPDGGLLSVPVCEPPEEVVPGGARFVIPC